MAQKVIYTRPDGEVSVVNPALGVDIDTVLARSIPGDAVNVTVVDETSIPTDREFRNAWRQSAGVINIPVTQARKVARRRITALVSKEIALLDDIRTKAQIENDTTLIGQVDARKATIQSTVIPAIRDGIANAATIASLKTVRRTYIDGRPQAVKDALP